MTKIKVEASKDQVIAQDFRGLIPKDVYDLCVEVSREGFSLTLVGGAVRDWLLTGHLPKDLDFELRHTFEYDEKDWSFRVNRLGERLREVYNYQVEFLSFSILRVSWPGSEIDVELGPARLEEYSDQGSYGHSDFQEVLVSNRPYEETFKRRDFTLNAMGIEFNSPQTADEFIFRDPFSGKEDLENGLLRPCGSHFSKDPVRFCRAIRFSLKYQLEFSSELKEMLGEFHLEKLSLFYLFREAFKVDFFKFIKTFYGLCDQYQIPLGEDHNQLRFLSKLKGENLQLRDERDILLFLTYHEDFSDRQQEVERFCELAKTKLSVFKAHIQFKETLINLEGFNAGEFKAKAQNLSWQEFIKLEEVANLKAFHQFVSRVGRDNLAILGRLNSHLYATFIKVYDVLPAALRGKELFEKLLKDEDILPQLRGDLSYFAHFQELWHSN